MADSYDDYLADGQGGGVGAADDDSYAEFQRLKRQEELARQRAAARKPAPVAPAPAAAAPTLDLGAVGLTPLPATPAPQTGAGASGDWGGETPLALAGRRLVPSDVTTTPATDQGGPGLRSRLALERESPASFSDALAHPGSAIAGAASTILGLAVDQRNLLTHPIESAKALGTAAVTAVPRALTLPFVAGEDVRAAMQGEEGPSIWGAAKTSAGGLLDAAMLTAPVVEGLARAVGAGRDAAYAAAAGESRYQSALERARSDALAARARRAGASGVNNAPTGAPLALPAGQYDLGPATYETRGEPETDPTRLLPASTIGAGVPTETGVTATAPIGLPPTDWHARLEATKSAAADASAARQQALGLPRGLLAPSVEEQEGATRAAEVSRENQTLRASPQDVDVYRRMRDAGVGAPGRDVGSPAILPGESYDAFAQRVLDRKALADADLERQAIQGEGASSAERETAARSEGRFSSAQTKGGALRPISQFGQLTDDALHEHMADLIDNKLGSARGAQQGAWSARLNAAEAELEARGHSTDDIWTTGLEKGRSALEARATPKGHEAGFTAAGPLGMIVGAGAGATIGALAAPEGQKETGAVAGAIGALGLVAVGAKLARDGGALETDASRAARAAEDVRAAAGYPSRTIPKQFQRSIGPGAPIDLSGDLGELSDAVPDRRRTGAIGEQPAAEDVGAGKTFPERLYSRSQRAIEQAPFKKGTAEQWAATLSKNVGQDERAALQPFLDENKGKVLSKADVLQAHAQTRIQLGEETFGGEAERKSHELAQTYNRLAGVHNAHLIAFRDKLESQLGIESALEKSQISEKVRLGGGEEFLASLSPRARAAIKPAMERYLEADRDSNAAHEAMNAHRGGQAAKYSAYAEPGGTNYREHVLTLKRLGAEAPEDAISYNQRVQFRARDMADSNGDSWEALGPNGRQRYLESANRELARPGEGVYRSSHWPETDNPIAHVRLSDRTLPSGEKALHVEEIQSDWHQQGRKRGYKGAPPTPAEAARVAEIDLAIGRHQEAQARALAKMPEEGRNSASYRMTDAAYRHAHNRMNELIEERRQLRQGSNAVPDAPFKKTQDWAELGLKKVIDEAVRGKYDRVTLASGEQQARRYDLSRQVDQLHYVPESGELSAMKDGRVVHEGKYDPKALPDVIGKEAAEKLLATEPKLARVENAPIGDETSPVMAHSLSGVDLKVGGEGMKSFYNKMLPNTIKDYAKKLGVKMELEPVDLGAARPLVADEVRTHADEIRNERGGGRQSGNVANVLDDVADWLEQAGASRSWRDAIDDIQSSPDAPSQRVLNEATIALESLEGAGGEGAPPEPNLSFKVTPALRAKVLKEGQRIGAADPKLIKTLGLSALGGVAGSTVGDTPAERRRNAIIGALGGAGAGALLSRESKALSAGEKAELGARVAAEREPVSPRQAGDAITATFAPASRGSEAAATARTMRAKRGQLERQVAIAQTTLDRVGADLNTKPIAKKLGFVDAIEHGAAQADKAQQPVANSIRRVLDEERDKIRALGTGKLENFIEDYFPHIWQDPDAAKNWLAQIMGKKPFEGSKAFLKSRTVPTVLEGMFPEGVPKNLDGMTNAEVIAENKRQGGLVPVSFNPVELTMLKLREMKKYRMAQEVIGDLGERGLLKPLKEGERIPVGYARIGDWAFTSKVAPEPVARVLNNYFSPGLRGNAAFDAYMAVGNTLNQAQLGLSAFHAGMTTIEAMVSHNALTLEKLLQGKAGEALKRFATSGAGILAPIENVKRGGELLRAYHQPAGTLTGPMAAITDAVAEAGGRPRMEGWNEHTKAFQNAREAKQYARMAKQFLPALLENTTGLVMNELVPRQKLGVFYDLAEHELGKLGPEASVDAVRQAVQGAWDSVDNRLGSLVYDNLFWNKAAKDVLHASVRSVGWNWGTFRELGGGTKDLAGFMKDLVSGKSPELSHRAAYAIALPLTTGLLGAITQYLYTGKGPDTLFDYFHPKTGTQDADGNANRVVLPTYMKDVYSYAGHPVRTITNKMNPLLSMVADALGNKNFYGDQIYDEPDFSSGFMKALTSSAKAAGQTAQFATKESLPFFLQNVSEGRKRGESLPEMAAAFVGVTPASREAVRTKAQNVMHDIIARKMPTQTPEEARASQVRADLRAKVKTHGAPAAMQELRARIADGTLTPRQVQNILKDDQTPALVKRFKSLSLADAQRVYDLGTEREKRLWLPVLNDKRARAGR